MVLRNTKPKRPIVATIQNRIEISSATPELGSAINVTKPSPDNIVIMKK
jgi:hypothetical protein